MKILNFGSLNIDTTLKVEHIVRPGETIAASSLETFPGGKGMNQSIAMGRALGKNDKLQVYHAGCIGEDGEFLRKMLEEANVDTTYLKTVDTKTGCALIQVEESGENCIVVSAGANHCITQTMVDEVMEHFGEGDLLVLQNEISSLEYILSKGKEKGMLVLLNPSPLDERIRSVSLRKIDFLMVNEQEAQEMLGINAPGDVGMILNMIAPQLNLIMTRGARGSVYLNRAGSLEQRAFTIGKPVDTTGAGDTFTGYFIAGLAEAFVSEDMMTMTEAIAGAMELGAAASGIAVTNMGAAASIPLRSEVNRLIKETREKVEAMGLTGSDRRFLSYEERQSTKEIVRAAIEKVKRSKETAGGGNCEGN